MRQSGTGAGRADLGLSEAAGWIAVAFGAVHLVVAPLDSRASWSRMRAQGYWNTATLAAPTTLAEAQRSYAFWTTLGSFGAPVLMLGCHVVWSARHGRRVPKWLGGAVLAWGCRSPSRCRRHRAGRSP